MPGRLRPLRKTTLAWEVKAYQNPALQEARLAPHMLGYIYEETSDSVIGVLVEVVSGRHPGIADLGPCQEALRLFHGPDMFMGTTTFY